MGLVGAWSPCAFLCMDYCDLFDLWVYGFVLAAGAPESKVTCPPGCYDYRAKGFIVGLPVAVLITINIVPLVTYCSQRRRHIFAGRKYFTKYVPSQRDVFLNSLSHYKPQLFILSQHSLTKLFTKACSTYKT